MSSNSAIPPNIVEVLNSKNGYVLVVTGEPGTGKSLFAREIFREYDNSYLISSYSENYSVFSESLSESVPRWDERHYIAHYWRNIPEEPLYKLSLKDQLKKLLGTEINEEENDVIIFDSWTGFISQTCNEDRREIEQSLIYAARKQNKKLVLVVEGDYKDDCIRTLLHSADSIILLQKQRMDQRMFRQMVIEKLRSKPLNQDMFLFTLDNGRFNYIPWYRHQYPAITVERVPISDPSKDRISTGNKSLDRLTGGGFRKGVLSLIEVDNLAAPYIETIYIPFLSNHLQLGGPAVILLPEGWSPERFSDGLSHFVDRKIVEKQVVFFGRHALGKDPNVRTIDNDPWKTLQEIRYESSQLKREFDRDVTELFALDTLENKFGSSVVKGMLAEISVALPSLHRVVVTVLSMQQEIKSKSISPGIHLRVQEIGGVLTACGVSPRTNFLAVRPILTGGFLDYELLPIV